MTAIPTLGYSPHYFLTLYNMLVTGGRNQIKTPRVHGRPYDDSSNPMQGSLPQGKAEKGTVPDP